MGGAQGKTATVTNLEVEGVRKGERKGERRRKGERGRKKEQRKSD